MSEQNLMALAEKLLPVALAAGEIELKYYREGAEVLDKADGSPVTLADQEAEKLIAAALRELAPDIPMVGEESVAEGNIPDISGGRFFLVDPLDGTKEFITGGGDFTVNIALLENFVPVMGVIYAPVSGLLYYGAGTQAFVSDNGKPAKQMRVRPAPDEGITVVASKRHGDPERLSDFLKDKKVAQMVSRSSSLKFCVIAAGEADFYPRLGPTSEWDTAAGDAILRAAGGQVTQLCGAPLEYGKADKRFLNPEFVAFAP
ncbi:MAG TPA: 3'(2'),5'-bisphosphate nucleotidase CysQ [Alphaproteobacteria bacterium]|nr:3'(2'),5'-bisphosphate nucleotidase CysQ [Alphaproteobacteria bacterium]